MAGSLQAKNQSREWPAVADGSVRGLRIEKENRQVPTCNNEPCAGTPTAHPIRLRLEPRSAQLGSRARPRMKFRIKCLEADMSAESGRAMLSGLAHLG